MKKLYIFATLAVAALGFTACEDDKEPVYNAPTEFVLNTPPMADQALVLTKGANINFTCTQPNYGVSLVTNYVLDVTVDSEFKEATVDAEGNEVPANYTTLVPTVAHKANFDVTAEDLCKYLLKTRGIEAFVDYPEAGVPDFKDVNFRARAYLTGIEGSEIASNVVTLANIEVYNPFPAVPGQIYFVGNPTDWKEPSMGNADVYADWQLEETGVGTSVYVGSFEIPAGDQYFRFYKELKGWGSDATIGTPSGENEALEFNKALEATKTEGCWHTGESWAGGAVTFTVDLSKPGEWTVTAKEGAVVKEAYAWLIGSFPTCNWQTPDESNAALYEDLKMVDRGITGIYVATIHLDADYGLWFRAVPELTGWGATPYSAASNGDNVVVTLGQPKPYETGEGCWEFHAPAAGDYVFTLDTKAGTMTVTAAE